MVLGAMGAIDAEGVSMCDAHPDLEVFRLRLGKALNFEYNEDTQTVRNPIWAFNRQADIVLGALSAPRSARRFVV
jgi:hypothetical protein